DGKGTAFFNFFLYVHVPNSFSFYFLINLQIHLYIGFLLNFSICPIIAKIGTFFNDDSSLRAKRKTEIRRF
ncbi:hypothetical protein Q604_UNBC18218G0001, partial [human gut metagenome]